MDVVSNAGFALVGILGLWFLLRHRHADAGSPFTENWERQAFIVLYSALAAAAAGSAWYHLSPNNATLVWDRLPMAVLFMSFFAMMIAERIGMRAGRLLFVPLVIGGVSSVVYWHYTETVGQGDVRFYALIQYFPMLAIPLMLLLFPPLYTRTADLVGVLGWYALAKLFELLDWPIFRATGFVSGHTLKHLAAAMAMYWLLRTLKHRRPVRGTAPPRARGAEAC